MQYLKESIDKDLIAEMAECSKEDLFRWRAVSKYPSDLPEFCSLVFPTGKYAELRFFEIISSALDIIFDKEVEGERKSEDYGQLLHVETKEFLDHSLDKIEESPIFFEDTLISTWVSSSECVACDQIENPKDHVHFEEYNDIKQYLSNVTDVEKVWYENKCMDVTQVGEEEWKQKKFFNLKSMVHYMKWGKFVEHYVSRATPKKISEVMESYYCQGKIKEANRILSSTLLGHDPPYFGNAMIVECESKIQHYRPYGVGTLTEVFPGESPGPVSFHTKLSWGTIQKSSMKKEFPQSLLSAPSTHKESWRRANPHVRMKAYDKYVSFPFTVHYEKNPWEEKHKEKDEIRKTVNDLKGLVHLTKMPGGDILIMGHPLWITEEKGVFFQQSIPYVTVMMDRWMKRKRDRYPPYCIYPRKRNGMLVWSMVYPVQLVILQKTVETRPTEEIPIQIVRRECACGDSNDLFSFCRTHGAVLDMGGIMVSAFCGPYVGDVIHIPEITPYLSTDISVTSSDQRDWTESMRGEHVIQHLDTEAHFFSWPSVLPIGCPTLGYRSEQQYLLLYCQSNKGSNVVNGYIGASSYQEWNLPIDLFFVIPMAIGESQLFQNVLFWILTIENRLSSREIAKMRGEEEGSKEKKVKLGQTKPMKELLLVTRVRPPPKYVCKVCLERKTGTSFSISQVKKGDLRKCKDCVNELLLSTYATDPPQKQ